MTKKILFLLSGGLDSSISLFMESKKKGFDLNACETIFFDRRSDLGENLDHRAFIYEFNSANDISKKILKKPVRLYHLPMNWYAEAKKERKKELVYPYGRNILLLVGSASFAATNYTGFESSIIVGFNKGDASSDTSPEFVTSFNDFLGIGFKQNNKIELKAPLINMYKSDIINYAYTFGQEGIDLIKKTWSCYEDGRNFNNLHCGKCDACKKRKEGFERSSKTDPTQYYQ